MARVVGDQNDNRLSGTAYSDVIIGLGGRDRLFGGGGDDTLQGGWGADTLCGGDGDDILVGGRGRDHLYGGDGSDTFRFDDRDAGDAFSGPLSDVIHDFSSHDLLDIMAVDVVSFDGFGTREPQRGGFSIWEAQGGIHLSWNTFGGFHDVEIKDCQISHYDLYQQILWFEDDYLANVNTTGLIAAGQTRDGKIEVREDRDWFRIELVRDQYYTFELIDKAEGGGTLSYGYFTLFDAGGNPVVVDEYRLKFNGVSGTYFLDVWSFYTGTYTLSASAVPFIDDYAGDTSTTGRIAAGESVNGALEIPEDRDWFKIDLEGDKIYRFEVNSETGTYLALFDADGNYVAHDGELEEFKGPTGSYYAQVSSYEVGTYQLTVSAVPLVVDDYAGDRTTTGEIAAGESAAGELEIAGDRDWFRIELESDQVYLFDVRGEAEGGGTLPDPVVALFDTDGNYVTQGSEQIPVNGLSGTYYAEVWSYNTGSYQLAILLDDFAGDVNTTGEISVGEIIDGELEISGDRDWFRIELESDQVYLFDVLGEADGGGTLQEPLVVLVNSDGSDAAVGYDQLDFQGASGTYYAEVISLYMGTYQLAVTAEPIVDDYAADAKTIGKISVGVSAKGEIEFAGDRDWFRISLDEGETYQIDLRGKQSASGTLPDPLLYLRDAGGVAVAEDDDGSGMLDSRLIYVADRTGDYFVDAGGFAVSQTGTYDVTFDLLVA